MFRYFVFVFVLLHQIRKYGCVDSITAPITVLDGNRYNFSEVTEEWKKKPGVAMSGQNNYHVGQQVFYIYNEQQLKQLLSEDGNFGYNTTPDIGTHKFHHIKRTWNEARKTCIAEGGHLAVINSPAEEKVLFDILKEKKIIDAWVGLHDLFQEGDWVTVLDEPSTSIVYMPWSTANGLLQPDNYGNGQNCGVFDAGGLNGLDDNDCNGYHSFFCETSA